MFLSKYIYLLGILARNNKIFDCYSKLKKCESWSHEKLRQYQFGKLVELTNHAYNNSIYYKVKFDNHRFHPGDLKSIEDLRLIPISTKEEVLSNSKGIQISNCGEKMFFSETSGSTGRPLIFYRNKEWDAWHNASVLRGYSWHNVNPWEKNGYLWGYNILPRKRLKVKFLDLLQNRFRLFSYKDEEISMFAKKLEVSRYLGGYSSMLYEVAKKVNAMNSSHKFDLKMIKGTSEKILDIYQVEVQKAFGRRIISEYGSAESGIIAFECAHGNMHINMETVIVEVEDNEIIITNLVSKSFPFIRYKLGDSVKLDENEKCKCGLAHTIIKEVTGRIGAVIHGEKNAYPSLTLYYVFKNIAMDKKIVINYQVVQKEQGSIDVYIESKLTREEAIVLKNEFFKYFDYDLVINIIDNNKRSDYKNKRKDFITYIK